MTNQPSKQDAARKSSLADMATKAATAASNKATAQCSKATHDLAAQANMDAYYAHKAAYDANAEAGLENDILDRHMNQMLEHGQLADHHRDMSKELALKKNGMEGSNISVYNQQLDGLDRKANETSVLANALGGLNRHEIAASAHREAGKAHKVAGNQHGFTHHSSVANFHTIEAAKIFSGGEAKLRKLYLDCQEAGQDTGSVSLHA